jgi:hypothetical protein
LLVLVDASQLLASGGSQIPPDLPAPAGSPRALAQEYEQLIGNLIDSLADSDAEVRQNAAIALATVGPRAVPALIDSLRDRNPLKRAAAAYALGQAGLAARVGVPALMTALKDEDRAVRRQASYAISRIISADQNHLARLRNEMEVPPPVPLAPVTGGSR